MNTLDDILSAYEADRRADGLPRDFAPGIATTDGLAVLVFPALRRRKFSQLPPVPRRNNLLLTGAVGANEHLQQNDERVHAPSMNPPQEAVK